MKKIIELPCQLGETVWVSPNRGKSFHSATLLGIRMNEYNESGFSFMVEVTDKDTRWVDYPMKKEIIDYFSEVWTREQMETRFATQ